MPDTRRSLSSLQTLLADNTTGDISAQDGRDVLVSNHPENVVQTAAFASEPASGQLTGDLFLPSDGFFLERYSGSAWAPWGPIFPFTKPVSGDFTWVNQGSASVVTTNGGVTLLGTSDASNSIRIRKKSAPSTPYTITAVILPSIPPANYASCGLLFRQSSDGKLCIFSLAAGGASGGVAGSLGISSTKFTNETTYSAHYVNPGLSAGVSPLHLRIADNGTNRICSLSGDGINWATVHSVGRTDFLTADEVGFFCDSNNGGTPAMTLLSWKEA